MTVVLQRAPYAGWRALAATVLVVCGAAGAHTWAGGSVPGWPNLVALAGGVFAASWCFLRGTLSWRVLLPALAVAQVALHELFGALDATSHAGHAHAAAESGGAAWAGRMVAAHAAVIVLTAVVWRLCERAAVAVIGLLEPRSVYAGGRRDPRRPVRASYAVPRTAYLLVAPRRGPPPGLRRA